MLLAFHAMSNLQERAIEFNDDIEEGVLGSLPWFIQKLQMTMINAESIYEDVIGWAMSHRKHNDVVYLLILSTGLLP